MDAINEDRLPFGALFDKACLSIEGCSSSVRCDHAELDPLKPDHVRSVNCVPQKPFAKSFASPFRYKTYEQVADMSGHRTAGGRYIAPSDDHAFNNGNDLRVAVLDIALHERAHLFDRRRLEEGKVFAFPRDRVDRSAKAFRVLDSNLA